MWWVSIRLESGLGIRFALGLWLCDVVGVDAGRVRIRVWARVMAM